MFTTNLKWSISGCHQPYDITGNLWWNLLIQVGLRVDGLRPGGVVEVTVPFFTVQLGGPTRREGTGPSTFTAWYIGDETSLIPYE